MAIRLYTGKPRAGKTLGAVRMILRELVNGKAVVVTNLPFVLGRVAEYVAKRNPEVHLADRLVLLDEEQARSFWRYRLPPRVDDYPTLEQAPGLWHAAGGLYVDSKPSNVDRPADRCDFSRWSQPAFERFHLYVIDEAQLVFGAREWQERGKELMYVASQHGKLRCDWVLITQSHDNIDRGVRSLVQDRTHFTNWEYLKFASFIKMPQKIKWVQYEWPSTTTVQDQGVFTRDMEECHCYETTSGVGVRSGLAPVERKVLGVSFWWLLLVFPVIGLLAWGFDVGSSSVIKHVVAPNVVGMIKTPPGGIAPPTPAAPAQPGPSPAPAAIPAPAPARPAFSVVGEADGTAGDQVTGYMRLRGVETWVMRSGRVFKRQGMVSWEERQFPPLPAPFHRGGPSASPTAQPPAEMPALSAQDLPAWPPEPIIIRRSQRPRLARVVSPQSGETNQVQVAVEGEVSEVPEGQGGEGPETPETP